MKTSERRHFGVFKMAKLTTDQPKINRFIISLNKDLPVQKRRQPQDITNTDLF